MLLCAYLLWYNFYPTISPGTAKWLNLKYPCDIQNNAILDFHITACSGIPAPKAVKRKKKILGVMDEKKEKNKEMS